MNQIKRYLKIKIKVKILREDIKKKSMEFFWYTVLDEGKIQKTPNESPLQLFKTNI